VRLTEAVNRTRRLGICLAVAGATVPVLGFGPAHAADCSAPAVPPVQRTIYRAAASPIPTPCPTAEDGVGPLGPNTDDTGDGPSTGTTLGLGAVAVLLIGGGIALRRRGRP
jgi:hypothetical protein